ncbi:thioesterase family protein [Streptacidiphilus sp. EB129]|uniref:thioesterase family protein n=1 Tax=Streptacidiphilus sp. EB129 TaxID=3156262 RepID=UPI0035149C14
MATATAFYVPAGPADDGDARFTATPLTRGPWSPDAQHAGPPAALLGRAVEQRADARPDFRVVRMTFEVLRPVPIAEVTVSTRLAEASRSVERVEAELRGPDGRVAMRATALRMRSAESTPGAPGTPAVEVPLPVAGPDDCPGSVFPVRWDEGYHTAVEVRFASGAFTERGPAACWFRPRYPLVADQETSGLSRVLIAADSGNGISGELDITRFRYVNADLTVHLLREPVGEWVGLDSRTSIDQTGIGLTDTLLMDAKSGIGRAAQSLFVAPW